MKSFPSTRRIAATFALSASLTSMTLAPCSAQAQTNYYALGDSYTFGYQMPTNVMPGNGNAPLYGYVGASTAAGTGTNATFSGYLANRLNQNVAVTNLGIPGETTYSYLGMTPPFPTPTHSIAANTNYTTTSQTQMGVFDALPANSSKYITLQLGGNDIINYLYDNIATNQTVTNTQIDTVENATIANIGTIVSDIKSRDTGATIFLMGYADPYPGITSNSAATTLNGYDVFAVQDFNAKLQALATGTATRYVGIYQQFVGNEAAYTFINTPADNVSNPPITLPDFHPNSTGYGVIAQQLEASAAAPEPSSLLLLGIPALLSATGFRCRARR